MSEFVTISIERLKELEALESSIPSMIDKAVLEYKKSNLKKLHDRDKANPAGINMRVKRYVERHREEINQKRREKRQRKPIETSTTFVNNLLCLNSETLKVESIFVRSANKAILQSENLIVRKQYKKKKEHTDNSAEKSSTMSSMSVSTVIPEMPVTPDMLGMSAMHKIPVTRNDITVRFDL